MSVVNPPQVSENTKVTLDFILQADIALAMERPIPEVTKTEFTYKDEIIRQTIMDTQQDVSEMKETLKLLETRIFELTKER